jgi:hypothetical protein
MGITAPAPTPISFQQPMPTNLYQEAVASSVMQQQDPFQHARTPITHIKREITQSIPDPELLMMEAENKTTWDHKPSSTDAL